MAGMSTYARTGYEVRVGVVGPSELVERAMLTGLPGAPTAHMLPSEAELGLHRRLVMAPYAHEQDAPEKVTRLGARRQRVTVRQPRPARLRPPGRRPGLPGHLHPARRHAAVRGAAAGPPGGAPARRGEL